MKGIVSILMLLFSVFVIGQNQDNDSINNKELKEVILIGKKAALHEKQVKALATIDEFLQQSSKVDMIKRGAYAWEPIINSMPTERTLITIDGMRIFGACTDKMDPVTSYVEVSNLSEATISSGQEGSCYGSTIGGSVDLKRSKTSFGTKKWEFHINSGYETNNQQKILGASIDYNDSLFFVDSDVMIRKAENYTAGNNREVLFSQFNKTNFSNTFGFKLKKNKSIEASLIYDKATAIGYPALPMDVSLAEAIITSVKYLYVPLNFKIKQWETKLYFNTIKHKMDDTTRPNVPIHMDMPGWSETFGYYSKLNFTKGKHHFLVNLNSFYNKSIAEMTMYPSDPNENLMFMYTWPDVRTFYNGLFLEDEFVFNCHSSLKFSTAIGSHINSIASQFGLESMRIFYPEMKAQKDRILKSFSSKYSYLKSGLEYSFGLAYGERAPSVSEGYGFYLFNSFDGYDNIGNPNLKNEKSLESSFSIGFKNDKLKLNISSSYFRIYDYVIAKTDMSLVPMTIGANGVRVYTAFHYATLFNSSISTELYLSDSFKWFSQVAFSKGRDNENNNLPFISPLSYNSSFRFTRNRFNAEISVFGNTTQTNYNIQYGEDRTPSYAIVNINAGQKFKIGMSNCITKIGVENVLDTYYSTYADWKNIPRMGRNLFINLIVEF